MTLKIHQDHSRFKQIVRGKIKANLRKYVQKGEMIGKKGGYVALVNQKFTFMRGSGVKGFETNSQMGGYPDLARIAVK